MDAASDASAVDGAVDGTQPDATAPTATCTFDETNDFFVLASAQVKQSEPPALAVRNDGAVVAWVAQFGLDPRVSAMFIPSNPTLPGVLGASDQESKQGAPAVTTTSNGFVVVWRDDKDGDYELLSRSISASGVASDTVHALTDNSVDDDAPVLATTSDGKALLVWKQELSGMGSTGRALLLDSDAAATGSTKTVSVLTDSSDGHALARFGANFSLAYVESGTVRVQRLDSDGDPLASATKASEQSNVVGPVDITSSPSGGALAFGVRVQGVRPEVRFRPVDTQGLATGAEKVMTPPPETGTTASVTALSGGYALGFRRTAPGSPQTKLRFVLVSSTGDEVDGLDLKDVQAPSTSTVVRSSPDGKLVVVAWTDNSRMLLARIRCQ